LSTVEADPLPLPPRELLTTTRGVRKRLDLSRPVPREVIVECVRDALQAPSGSNRWAMQFVVIDDPDARRRVGDIYRAVYESYKSMEGVYIGSLDKGDAALNEQQQRTARSADYLGEHMGDAPALVIGCILGRPAQNNPASAAMLLSSAIPGMWSFMLAARLRGLGTAWTSLHLLKEQEAADALGIPYDEVTQVCLTPLAYTKGTDFKPALRPDPEDVIHWNRWTPRAGQQRKVL
jgi:nitroreductase